MDEDRKTCTDSNEEILTAATEVRWKTGKLAQTSVMKRYNIY